MKATGIVRRIDELGRVVIPKEIRRSLRIKDGDPLEIFTSRDGEIIFKKYDDGRAVDEWVEEIMDKYGSSIQGVHVDHMDKYGSSIQGVHVNHKITTVYTSMGVFRATCADGDEFKFNVGVAVALARAYQEELPSQLER